MRYLMGFSGDRLQGLRKKRGLSVYAAVAQVYSKTGRRISPASFYNWERGHYTPSFDDVCALAAGLEVPLSHFAVRVKRERLHSVTA